MGGSKTRLIAASSPERPIAQRSEPPAHTGLSQVRILVGPPSFASLSLWAHQLQAGGSLRSPTGSNPRRGPRSFARSVWWATRLRRVGFASLANRLESSPRPSVLRFAQSGGPTKLRRVASLARQPLDPRAALGPSLRSVWWPTRLRRWASLRSPTGSNPRRRPRSFASLSLVGPPGFRRVGFASLATGSNPAAASFLRFAQFGGPTRLQRVGFASLANRLESSPRPRFTHSGGTTFLRFW